MLSAVAGTRERFYGTIPLETMRVRVVFSILAASGVMLCSSCSSNHYKVTLRDGSEFMTASKPEFNKKTGYYKFRALNDKDALIRSDEIVMMQEL